HQVRGLEAKLSPLVSCDSLEVPHRAVDMAEQAFGESHLRALVRGCHRDEPDRAIAGRTERKRHRVFGKRTSSGEREPGHQRYGPTGSGHLEHCGHVVSFLDDVRFETRVLCCNEEVAATFLTAGDPMLLRKITQLRACV